MNEWIKVAVEAIVDLLTKGWPLAVVASVVKSCREIATLADGEADRANAALASARSPLAAAETAYSSAQDGPSALAVDSCSKQVRLASVVAQAAEAKRKSARETTPTATAGLSRFERELARVLAQHDGAIERLEKELAAAVETLKAPMTWAERSRVAEMQRAIAEFNARCAAARGAGADAREFREADVLPAIRALVEVFELELGTVDRLHRLRDLCSKPAHDARRDIGLLEDVVDPYTPAGG